MRILVFLCACLMMPAFAGQERGGGKQVERDYVEIATLLFNAISDSVKRKEIVFDGFDLEQFRLALLRTQVSAMPQVCRTNIDVTTGGATTKCVDADYDRWAMLIEFSERSWAKMNCLERFGHTLHEYGRASGNEDGNYRFSSRVYESQALADACTAYEKELRCDEKVDYLAQALKKLNTELDFTKEQKDLYIVRVENTMEKWWESKYGMKCATQSEKVCMDICMQKVASLSCMRVCEKH